ncbi:hypothetical protein EON64_07660, partial [archaeon]
MSSKNKWAHAETSDEEEEPQQVPEPEVAPQQVAAHSEPAHNQPRNQGHSRGHGFKGLILGVDFHMTEQELGNFLHSIGIQVRHLDFIMDSGKFTGRAVVTVANDASLQTLLDMDGGELHGRVVHTKVYEDRHPPRDRGGRG